MNDWYQRLGRWLGVGALSLGPMAAWTPQAWANTPASRLAPLSVELSQQSRLCPAQLPGAIAQVTRRPGFERARWGILVQTLAPEAANRQTLYAQEADRYFTPASTVKLMTTAAALRELGPQFRIRTSVYQVGDANQTLLRVVGRGDPSFDQEDLRALAQQIRDRDIQRVDQLIGNDQFFQGDPVHPNWEWEDVQAGYGAPINSLILNQNEIVVDLVPQELGQPLRVEWRDASQANQWQIENRSVTVATTEPEFIQVGRDLNRPILRVSGQLRVGSASEDASISVPEPAANFLQQLRSAIAAVSIPVTQAFLATEPITGTAPEIAFVDSPPLSELLIETNRWSNNLYAEALLKQVGHRYATTSSEAIADSTAAGILALSETLTQIGVNPNSYQLVDGSGLSRQNQVSPEALVQTLQGMASSPEAPIYRASLAVAGSEGTLSNRFQNTAVAEQLQGKTGTLSGTAALAGYFAPPQYEPLAFSIMVNHAPPSGAEVRRAIDDIVLLLAQLQDCGSPRS